MMSKHNHSVDITSQSPVKVRIISKHIEEENEKCIVEPQSNASVSSDKTSDSLDLSPSDLRKRKLDDYAGSNDDKDTSRSKKEYVSASKDSNNLSLADVHKNDKDNEIQTSRNTSVVTEHYNTLEEKGLSQRFQSRIVYMRNFNNWIKSILINEYLRKIRDNCSYGTPLKVLDMCCGKGGDLFKWRQANISHLICADVAGVSVKQCESRYNDIVTQNNDRNYIKLFSAEFITADCTKVRLRERYKDPSIQLDLVSCQFALHYSFESLQQAECMIRNASENLKPGGYFIATIPNAADLVYQWRQIEGNKFGNDIYNVKFCSDDKNNIPLFGAKYNFHLEEVVDCPEFLVYLPLLIKLAMKFGLEFLSFERFNDYYKRFKNEEKSLLTKMQALETYPSHYGIALRGKNPDEYQHVVEYIKKHTDSNKMGTLTLSEWEAISLYGVVSFKKLKTTWNSEGKPEYSK